MQRPNVKGRKTCKTFNVLSAVNYGQRSEFGLSLCRIMPEDSGRFNANLILDISNLKFLIDLVQRVST